MEVEAPGAGVGAAIGPRDTVMLLWTKASVIGPTSGLTVFSFQKGTPTDAHNKVTIATQGRFALIGKCCLNATISF